SHEEQENVPTPCARSFVVSATQDDRKIVGILAPTTRSSVEADRINRMYRMGFLNPVNPVLF
ncbi:MAG: hypothetical protein M3Y03_00270, partial [Verrucomicrobiota bacterium]|nr:hypothetical protein [Verrucomicrobiota bacterium]